MNDNSCQFSGDKLRAQLTAWLEKVIIHAKIDYLRKAVPDTLPLEDIPDEKLLIEDAYAEGNGFAFENGKLLAAFLSLTDLRREILTLVFVHGASSSKIAALLGCTVAHVHTEKYRALRKLRNQLMNGGDDVE